MAMFESLSKRLEGVFTNLSGKGKLTEADVNEAMREVRLALLEADVSLKVVRQFVERVREKAIGADVLGSFSPAQQVLAIVNEELIEMLGGTEGKNKLDLGGTPPTVIMLVGLQGSGKTTTAAKLANYLRKQGQRPLMVAADMYRPAAVRQLQTLGKQTDRSRAVHVSGHHQRALALLAQVVGQLGRGSRFTRTLQANQHDNCRRCATQVELVLSLGSSQHFYH